MSEQLEHCDFCGSKKIGIACDKDSLGIFFYASCNDCEAQGPTERTLDKAIEKWNTRLTYDDYLSNQQDVQPAV